MSLWWMLVVLAGCSKEPAPGPSVGVLFGDDTAGVARPSNLLVISLDTTRRDMLGPWRASSITPNLDALFERGLLLANHRSCSNWTFASVLCLQAGARGEELGFIPSTSEGTPEPAPDSLLLASELLRDRGWRSLLITANGYFSPDVNLADGFDEVDLQYNRPAAEMTDLGLAALEDFSGQSAPWYLQLHYMDPHSPYDPPEGYRDAFEALAPLDYQLDTTGGHNELKSEWAGLDDATQALAQQHIDARYAGELAYADAEIGRFLAEAEAAGALEDTLVVFWTDHGEQLFDHGDMGHKYGLYEEENRAVVAFVAEGVAPAVWEGPTSHQDLWPTLLQALEIPQPESFTGLPLGERSDDSPRFALRHSGDPNFQFVERDGVKLLYWWDGRKALFRLDDDPDESQNVYSQIDPNVAALWELLMPEVERVQYLHPEYTPVDPGP